MDRALPELVREAHRMDPPTWMNDEHREKTVVVCETLLSHPDLLAAELAESSGMILAVRRIAGPG